MSDSIDVSGGAVKVPNPLLQRMNKIPGLTIQLPSKGIFYTDGELDDECSDGEVIVYPMTTTDELIMRSPDMLFQGTAVKEVLSRCLPQIKKPMQLLVADVDYILTNLRKISYGTHIPIRYNCDCLDDDKEAMEKLDASGDNEYVIPVDHFIQNTKPIDSKIFGKEYKVEVSTGQVVALRPLRYCDFIKLQQMDPENLKEVEDIREYVAINFAALTKSVDDVNDPDMIKEWYKALYRFDTEKIRDHLDAVTPWGIDFTYKIKCRQCKKEKELTTQLNPVYFFMLPSSPERKKTSKNTSKA